MKRRFGLVASLRRRGIWVLGQRAHRLVSPPICAALHVLVDRLGPRFLPADLVLKHLYDYRPIFVDPASVGISLRVGSWRYAADGLRVWARLRRWYEFGGGWKTARRHLTRNLHGRFVAGGDWDEASEPFDGLAVVNQLFAERIPPNETDLYRRQLAKIEAGELAWTKGRRTREELDEQFALLIRAYEAIRTSGYRTQQELGEDGADEIRVCVDRHGRLCLFGAGSHRLAMAKMLELPRVPVTVGRVHASWLDEWKRRLGTTDPVLAVARGIERLAFL